MEETGYLFALSSCELAPRKLMKLLKSLGSGQAIWEASSKELTQEFTTAQVQKFSQFRKNFQLSVCWKEFQNSGISARAITDSDYPKALKEIADPPLLLFVLGSFKPEKEPVLAIVGSRTCTPYGKLEARKLGESLASLGITVVSGLARGIDMAAHQGALDAGGNTWAVLGSGLDRIYPSENENLARRIQNQGALLSEFPPGTPPDPQNFPRRNRVISGLSLGVIVVEAREKSGALITAKFALEQGREVFACPGLPGGESAAGSNKLIQGGAKLVQEIWDILEEFPYLSFQPAIREPEQRPEVEEKILASLGRQKDGKVVELLMKETKLPMDELTGTLLVMETKGLVVRLPGNVYTRT